MFMLDYNYYTRTYHGNQIALADIPRLITRAGEYLDSLGCDLSGVPPDTMDKALCAVAEAWRINEQGGDIVSQSAGPWSKSYAQKKPKTDDQRLREAAALYLGKYCNLSVRWC